MMSRSSRISVSSHKYSCITAAYKHADGKKIDGRRVLVDVERARTVKGWLPRRLGKLTVNLQKHHSGSEGFTVPEVE
jgi:hypothetical protein